MKRDFPGFGTNLLILLSIIVLSGIIQNTTIKIVFGGNAPYWIEGVVMIISFIIVVVVLLTLYYRRWIEDGEEGFKKEQ